MHLAGEVIPGCGVWLELRVQAASWLVSLQAGTLASHDNGGLMVEVWADWLGVRAADT